MIRYKQLAAGVRQDILQERLSFGHRMPAIRKFAKLHAISVTTALNCYQLLQEQGWLSVKPQSGYFVSRPLSDDNVPDFPNFAARVTVPQNYELAEQHLRQSPFYTAQLAESLIPKEVLNRCFHRANLRSVNRQFQYPSAAGEEHLRSALAAHISEFHFNLQAQQLIITNGCLDAVRSSVEIVSNVGDTIAVASPCFSGLLNLLQSMQRKVLEIPSHNARLDLAQLEQYMSSGQVTAGLFSANFVNPHGLCLSDTQKQALVNLANQYSVPIIEDDVFLELGYNHFKPKPIKYWDDRGWVIWCGSISKSLAPSYRLGWCVPGRFYTQYLAQRQLNALAVNVPVQGAIYEFINSGQYAKHLKKTQLRLAQQNIAYRQLLTTKLPKNAQISVSQGGMLIWLQIKGANFSQIEQQEIQGLHFKSGTEFSTLALYQDCIRLNIGWPLEYQFKDGSTVGDKLQQLCKLINSVLN